MWLHGTNFCNNALVHSVLHRHSCSYETIPNAPKYCETDWNICLGSTSVDWVCLLRKIPSWLRGINFCINCTSSPRFAPSFMQLRNDPNGPKHYETHRNIGIGSNGVDWLFSLRKIPMWLHGTNFCNNCTSSPCFAPTFMQLRNDPKCTEILWNRLKH